MKETSPGMYDEQAGYEKEQRNEEEGRTARKRAGILLVNVLLARFPSCFCLCSAWQELGCLPSV
jgi:membrane protein YqaA with SNARE-associated domain